VVVVPVLRAGLGMFDAVLELMPTARVGHIGLQRDEATAQASKYYAKLPHHLADSFVLLVDPMLATGGSAVAALDFVKAAGARTIARCTCRPGRAAESRHPMSPSTPVVDRELKCTSSSSQARDFGDVHGTL
jgi:uracil phosphoribosyltransferase